MNVPNFQTVIRFIANKSHVRNVMKWELFPFLDSTPVCNLLEVLLPGGKDYRAPTRLYPSRAVVLTLFLSRRIRRL